MFVNIVEFPPVPADAEAAFLAWFAESNAAYAKYPGFLARRLLRDREGRFVGLVEHESEATFRAMHDSPERETLGSKGHQLFTGRPAPRYFDVVLGSEASSAEIPAAIG